jgi:hypothetical protein
MRCSNENHCVPQKQHKQPPTMDVSGDDEEEEEPDAATTQTSNIRSQTTQLRKQGLSPTVLLTFLWVVVNGFSQNVTLTNPPDTQIFHGCKRPRSNGGDLQARCIHSYYNHCWSRWPDRRRHRYLATGTLPKSQCLNCAVPQNS